MLLWLVIAYLTVSIGIGLYAATKIHNARDYIVAGRNLPFSLCWRWFSRPGSAPKPSSASPPLSSTKAFAA